MREGRRCRRYEAAPARLKDVLLGDKPVYAPDRAFDTLHVRLDIGVDFPKKTVNGLCTTRIRAFENGLREVTLRAAGMKILGAKSAGRSLSFRHKNDTLKITLPGKLTAGEETVFEVRYRISKPSTGFHFVGPNKENRKSPVQLWSQGQPEDAHYWFPCHDSPDEKATSEIVATVPKGFVAVSNGLLSSRRKEGGKEIFHWHMRRPHS
ncbi:MAG: hypothetical protein COV67_07925, partial [Nitrospinae bacterium CG11_big_fil_rev_8_21_14_0_20_56_8]